MISRDALRIVCYVKGKGFVLRHSAMLDIAHCSVADQRSALAMAECMCESLNAQNKYNRFPRGFRPYT